MVKNVPSDIRALLATAWDGGYDMPKDASPEEFAEGYAPLVVSYGELLSAVEGGMIAKVEHGSFWRFYVSDEKGRARLVRLILDHHDNPELSLPQPQQSWMQAMYKQLLGKLTVVGHMLSLYGPDGAGWAPYAQETRTCGECTETMWWRAEADMWWCSCKEVGAG